MFVERRMGKTLGIIGFGRIGRAVAGGARDFRMRVIYNSTTRAPRRSKGTEREYLPRDRVLDRRTFFRFTCRCARKRAD